MELIKLDEVIRLFIEQSKNQKLKKEERAEYSQIVAWLRELKELKNISKTPRKKLRKQYRHSLDSMAHLELKKEIFRLARNRDILGIVVILEAAVLAVSLFLNLR
jgi:pantothenate synthetase